MLRASDLVDNLAKITILNGKPLRLNEVTGELIAPQGSIGYRWGEKGKWNLEQKDGKTDARSNLRLSLVDTHDESCQVLASHTLVALTSEHFQNR